MTIKKYALLTNNLAQRFAIWDGVTEWEPPYTKADISTLGFVKLGAGVHVRSSTYTHNIVADGNSLVVGDSGTTTKTIHNGILDSGLTTNDFIIMARNGWITPDLTAKAILEIDSLIEPSLTGKNILIFWEGTNDLNNGKTDAQAYANIKAYCQARKPHWDKVLVCTLLPRTGSANANQETYRLSVNASIRAAKAANETWLDEVIDIGADATIGSTGSASNLTYYADGIHLTNAGHTIAKAYITSAINLVK